MAQNLIKLICICCFLLFFHVFIPSVIHAEEGSIFIDGKPIKTKYLIREDHLLVPALFLKHSGAYVDWDENYRSVVFRENERLFAIPVGENYFDEFDRDMNVWKRGDLTTKSLDLNGEIFVPLVDVVRHLGMDVRYDSIIKRTFVTTNHTVKTNFIGSVNPTKRLVSLTFDDGPDYYYTPMILDILKEKKVPATFFVMGRKVNDFPKLMKRMVKEGHAIGNHTWSHPNLGKTWSSKVKEEIVKTQQELQRVIGRQTELFRPPYGAVTKADVNMMNELGMKNIGWSVDTLDWQGLSAEQVLENVHRQIEPGGIILQHNFEDGRVLEGSVEALPKIIDDLQKQGYQFVTIPTLLDLSKE